MKQNNTAGARDYAADVNHKTSDVDAHWWEFFSGYRLKQWRTELKKCVADSGMSVQEICEKTGLTYSNDTVFFARLPKRRESYIGIGMVLGQPLETIERDTDRDNFMSAEEAMEYGIVDHVIEKR